MAPPPVERSGGESTAADAARSLPTPFLTKTYQLVDDKPIDDIISWNDDGSTFIVWNPTEFAKDLLPKYFKHNNFSSFVRQLNTYGFRKVVPDRWEFSNDCFRRGEKRLLCDIQRRKISTPATPTGAAPIAAAPLVTVAAIPSPPLRMVSPTDSGEEQVISSNSSREAAPVFFRETISGSNEELIDENDRLRRENVQLNKELTQMKSLCGNIYSMMSNYATNPLESSSPAAAAGSNTGNNQAGSCTTAVVKPLDLLPLKRLCDDIATANRTAAEMEEELSPRLFGVTLGLKRSRECEGVTTEQYQELLQLQQPGIDVKSETLDRESSGDHQGSSWVKHYRRPDVNGCSSRD